jgi:ribosome-associated toxin RatA of RatAB toxin-antitoxin module
MEASLKPVRHSAFMAGASPAEVFAVVVDFPAYPRLFPEIKQARVLQTEAGRVRVEFRGNLLLPYRYVLDLDCDAQAGTVKWTYVEGELVKDSTGGWRFAAEAGGTRVDYQATLRIEAPVPGFLLRKITDILVTLSLPAMFASIEREVGRRR